MPKGGFQRSPLDPFLLASGPSGPVPTSAQWIDEDDALHINFAGGGLISTFENFNGPNVFRFNLGIGGVKYTSHWQVFSDTLLVIGGSNPSGTSLGAQHVAYDGSAAIETTTGFLAPFDFFPVSL